MKNIHFDVDTVFEREDDGDDDLNFNLTVSALSNKADDLNSVFSDLNTGELWDKKSLNKAIGTKELLVKFVELFKKEVEKLKPLFEVEDFEINDISDKLVHLAMLVDKSAEYFDEAESLNVDFGDLDIDNIKDFDDLCAELNEDADSFMENISSFMENFDEKIEETQNFHKVLEKALEDMNVDMDDEAVIEELVEGKDFSDIYKEWTNEQWDYLTPTYNYIYPLSRTPSNNKCIEVFKETPIVVITLEGKPYLALRGSGMDCSQYIGYAKGVILNEPLAFEDCINISTQEGLNIEGEQFTALMDKMANDLKYMSHSISKQLDEVSQFTSFKKDAPNELDALLNKYEKANEKVDATTDGSNESRKTRRDK